MRSPVSALSNLARAGLAGLSGLVEDREDSWQNVAMGFGTSRDKTAGTSFSGPCIPLTDQECVDLFQFDDIAGKIVSALPREAFREGFSVDGIAPEKAKLAKDALERFQLAQQCKTDAIWGRDLGGCATWLYVDDGLKQAEPLDLTKIRTVHRLVTVDKRFLQPYRYYTDGGKAGLPELYMMYVPSPHGQVNDAIGVIHESRLVLWPGDMTEARAKIQRGGWDYSVLQKPYDALKSSGNTWKAIEILTSDANQAVYKIKNLWRMIASDPTQGEDSKGNGQPSGGLLLRIRFMDLVRSVSKAIVLDADGEEFERTSTTFTGLADLSDRAWNRVAAAADMPVTILTGQSPAGLQATGASDLRWWYGKVASEQKQTYEPRVKRIIQVCLSAQDSGVTLTDQEFRSVSICWAPLWAPTAAELSAMRLQFAQAAQILIQEQAITPEEGALSMPEEYFPGVDRKRLEERLRLLSEEPVTEPAALKEPPKPEPGVFGDKGKPREDGNPDQPRDEQGRWTDEGVGGSSGTPKGGSSGRAEPRATETVKREREQAEKEYYATEQAAGDAEIADSDAQSDLDDAETEHEDAIEEHADAHAEAIEAHEEDVSEAEAEHEEAIDEANERVSDAQIDVELSREKMAENPTQENAAELQSDLKAHEKAQAQAAKAKEKADAKLAKAKEKADAKLAKAKEKADAKLAKSEAALKEAQTKRDTAAQANAEAQAKHAETAARLSALEEEEQDAEDRDAELDGDGDGLVGEAEERDDE